MRRFILIAVPVILLTVVSRAEDRSSFWAAWGDGKAEMDGYSLIQPRYGQLRRGRAVLIFVTEDHSPKELVKIEGDTSNVPADQKFPVLKLNFVKTFQTGVYDYKVLTSVFARVDDGFLPSKISLSVQEWCGHVYQQLLVRGTRVEQTLHSYFGGEADRVSAETAPANAVFEDAVPILVRELQGDWIKAGATVNFPSAPSLLALRFSHKPFSWQKLTVTKSASDEVVQTPLGRLAAIRWTVTAPLSGTTIYLVEKNAPHRILRWTTSLGEVGDLLGSTRLDYWAHHDNGDERYLNAIFGASPAKKR